MEKLVPLLYRSYGTYCNQSKMLPNIVDGLLPVQRRLLLTCHLYAKSWQKTAKVLGDCMSNFHPHSEASGTAEQLVHNEFADGDGQWGTRIGIEPIGAAAMRYTKMKANTKIEEMAFRYVKSVNWVADDLQPEPPTLPTMFPFCLMSKYEISLIAFGFKTELPCYKKEDLVKRLMFLLGKGNNVKIKPNLQGVKVTGGEFEDVLTKGKGKIDVQGLFKINKAKKTVEVNGWSPRAGFPALLNKIDKYKGWKLLSNNDIGYLDQTGKGTGQTKVIFQVAKQRNIDAIFKKMCKAIEESLKSTHSYTMFVVDETGLVQLTNVDEMLMKAYTFHKAAFEKHTQDTITKLTNQISEYKIIEKIRPHISKVVGKHKDDVENACIEFAQLASTTPETIKDIIERYKIKRLLSIKVDITELKTKVTELTANLKKSDTVCLDMYKNL